MIAHPHRRALTIIPLLTLALVIGTWIAVPVHHTQASEAPVTFNRHIAPILYRNCTDCHHSGGSGPFALTSYAEAKRWGSTIADVTQSRYMPPWLPDPHHGDFADVRRLSAEEIALLRRWTDTGMLEGNPSESPKPPSYANDWQLGPPDLILEVDSPTEVPASGADFYRNFILPVPITATRWVRAMQIRPGSPQVVHHANLILDRTASLRRAHPSDWKQGVPGMDLVVDSGETFDPDSHFLYWKPDSAALIEPPTMPWRLDPGNDLILNMHLKPSGKPETVRARIALYFTPKPATELPILLQLEHDAALDIPAGDPAFIVRDQLTLPEDVDLFAIYPHAHYLGKRLEGWAILPNGQRKDLILISNWDIDRQSIYRYSRPVPLPRGSVVHMQYTYDNSAANPHNPSSPPVRVRAGNRSADEMGHLWLQVLPHPARETATDPRAPLLQAWMEARLRKDPADPEALFNLGSLHMQRADFADAAGLYRQALQARPSDPRTMTALGSALAEQGEWQDARSAFQTALKLDATYTDARFNLAVVDLQHGELAGAEEQFRALLALNQTDVNAHTGLGSTLLAEDRAAEAASEFRAALGLDANSFDALYNLATIAAGSGDWASTLDLLQRAAVQHPRDLDTHRSLAEVYAHLGRNDEAAREQHVVQTLSSSGQADAPPAPVSAGIPRS